MRWLINYFRSCFCKHEWELLFHTNVHRADDFSEQTYEVKTYRCKHCGYTQKYKSN